MDEDGPFLCFGRYLLVNQSIDRSISQSPMSRQPMWPGQLSNYPNFAVSVDGVRRVVVVVNNVFAVRTLI